MRVPAAPADTLPLDRHEDGVWQTSLKASAILLIALMACALWRPEKPLTFHFLIHQDLPMIVLMVTFGLLYAGQGQAHPNHVDGLAPAIPFRRVVVLAVATMSLAWLGRHLLMSDYSLSRDEQLVLFDVTALGRGRIYGNVPTEFWQFSDALNLTFMSEGVSSGTWMSVYLKGNALLHALLGMFGLETLTNGILRGAELLAVWAICRQIWPGKNEAHAVALLLYVLSTQCLVISMTTYAMTGHLALNMIWLWLFLRDRWASHIAAMIVGFLATGLHQLPFHPMFAAPILCLLLWRRQWSVAAFYFVGYALTGIVWVKFLELNILTLPPGITEGQGAARVANMAQTTVGISWSYIEIQSANLLRFFAWQHLLLLPLMLVGGWRAWKTRDPLQLCLLASFLLVVVARYVLRPYQGHGWGYRYMHGYIGIACIIATFGWMQLRGRSLVNWSILRTSSLVTLAIQMPWLLWQMHNMVEPYAQVSQRIDKQSADVVIVDDTAVPFGADLVINKPDVDNRPVRLLASALNPDDMQALCKRGAITGITAGDMGDIGRYFDVETGSTSRIAELARSSPIGCWRILKP